jgi:AraC-like DNA-binding protein
VNVETVPLRLYLWPHRLLYVGPGLDARMHRHHAAQVCWGLGGRLRLKAGPQGEWEEMNGFFVPPDRPHAFDASGSTVAMLYLESECVEFASLQTRIDSCDGSAAFEPPQVVAESLRAMVADGGSIDVANSTCVSWLGLEGPGPGARGRDPRIAQALALLSAQIDRPVRLQTLAGALNVSPGWLSHRFAEDTGVPLRRYVVWLRLRRAVESVLQGASWTEAAHAVGFSDSAHLSRSFRDTFGIAPSSLFRRGDQLSICCAN